MNVFKITLLSTVLALAGCASKPGSRAPETQAWRNDVSRNVASMQEFLQAIDLSGEWTCAIGKSSAKHLDLYKTLQSGRVSLLTDVKIAREIGASVMKMRFNATTSPYVLSTSLGPIYLMIVENNTDDARDFATRYHLMLISPKEVMPILFPLREMTLNDFKDNRITIKEDTRSSRDEATCGPKNGAFFSK